MTKQLPKEEVSPAVCGQVVFPISANVLAARGTLVAEERDTVPELAALNIGGLQVSGAIWASGSSGEAWEVYPQLESSAGYGLVLRYGDSHCPRCAITIQPIPRMEVPSRSGQPHR